MWRQGPVSLAYLTVDGATPVAHVELAAAAGFDAAGVRILPPTHLVDQPAVVGDDAAVAALAAACRQTGVDLLDAEVMSLTPETDAAALTRMADTAATLGFRFVQTVVEDTDYERAADKLGCLADAARAAGIGVALEFMAFRPLQTMAGALALIDATGADNIGLVIDALHLDRSGGRVADVAALPESRIAMVQLCDAPAARPADEALATEARSGRLHPGEGALPLTDLLDVLPDGLPIGLEVPHPGFAGLPHRERATRTMEAFRKFLANRSRQRGVDS